MSQTKYVEHAGQGFYVYDVALGVFLKYFIDAVEESDQAESPWLAALVSSSRLAACVQDIGLTLNEHGDWTAEQGQVFIALARKACAAIQARASIPADEMAHWRVLDDRGIFARGAVEVLTGPVVELAHAVVELVSRELPDAPKGKAWLYGTPSGREQLTLRQ